MCEVIMQDTDLFDGVIGKYTDRFEENGIKKNDDMEIPTKLSTYHRPRMLDSGVHHCFIYNNCFWCTLCVFVPFCLSIQYHAKVKTHLNTVAKIQNPRVHNEIGEKKNQITN